VDTVRRTAVRGQEIAPCRTIDVVDARH
jgi:hypothetical protein